MALTKDPGQARLHYVNVSVLICKTCHIQSISCKKSKALYMYVLCYVLMRLGTVIYIVSGSQLVVWLRSHKCSSEVIYLEVDIQRAF